MSTFQTSGPLILGPRQDILAKEFDLNCS
uniref:Uncharacterized protein n=1 Tax=Anguilla anguilla TaxID=7936 RepID=A0A0E9TI48_ANGAN